MTDRQCVRLLLEQQHACFFFFSLVIGASCYRFRHGQSALSTHTRRTHGRILQCNTHLVCWCSSSTDVLAAQYSRRFRSIVDVLSVEGLALCIMRILVVVAFAEAYRILILVVCPFSAVSSTISRYRFVFFNNSGSVCVCLYVRLWLWLWLYALAG